MDRCTVSAIVQTERFMGAVRRMVSLGLSSLLYIECRLISLTSLLMTGTIRLWQTSPGTTYGLWQSPHGQQQQAGEANGNGTVLTY